MQVAAGDGDVARREFPFGFRRQAGAAPARIGIGFVQRNVGDRARRVQRLQAVQREFQPATVFLAPVQRLLYFAAADLVPALGQPQRRIAVAAGVDKFQVLAVRHQARGQLEGRDVLAVARQLVVEAEAGAAVADLGQAALEVQPAQRPDRAGGRQRRIQVGRVQRILRQQVLQVGQDQLLVLLLVLHAEFHQHRQLAVLRRGRQQARDARVDVAAPRQHLVQAGPRQQAALGPRMLRADAVVIGIEQHPVGRVKRPPARLARLQDEGLEEPGGVRQVPLDRAGVGHRLRAAVLKRQRLGQVQRALAHLFEFAGLAVFVRSHDCPRSVQRARRNCARVNHREPAALVGPAPAAAKPACSSSPTAAAGRYL